MRDRVRRIMAEVFGVDELPENVTTADVAQWDSLRHLELMLELELEFGVEISSEVMPELVSLDAIETYLQDEVPA